MNPQQYQVLVPTPGCSVGDILTANSDGSLTSTDKTVTYQPTAENFSVNFGAYDPTTSWKPLAQQPVWTFAWDTSRPPALSVTSMPFDPNSTELTVLGDSLMVFPTEAAATAALQAMLAILAPLTNTAVQALVQPVAIAQPVIQAQ